MNLSDSKDKSFDACIHQFIDWDSPAEGAFGLVPLHVGTEARQQGHDPAERDLAVDLLIQEYEEVVGVGLAAYPSAFAGIIVPNRESERSLLNEIPEAQNFGGTRDQDAKRVPGTLVGSLIGEPTHDSLLATEQRDRMSLLVVYTTVEDGEIIKNLTYIDGLVLIHFVGDEIRVGFLGENTLQLSARGPAA